VPFGTFLVVAAAMVCLADGLARVGGTGTAGGRLSVAAAAGAAAWALAVFGICLAGGYDGFRRQTPLGLPGAELLRLPADRVADYRGLADAVRSSSDAFVVTTGLNSLYAWTGERPPSRVVIGNSIRVFTEDEQVGIVRSLLAHPRPMIIHDRDRGPPAETPFMRETVRLFHPWRRVGPYTLFVPNDRPDPAGS
jgi:hypothetical protein